MADDNDRATYESTDRDRIEMILNRNECAILSRMTHDISKQVSDIDALGLGVVNVDNYFAANLFANFI
jgi:NCAIR mutase (PurE)-related protein